MQINSEPTRRQLMDQVKQQIDEIERLREQAHYHYENGLKKDVEIERLREALQKIVEFYDCLQLQKQEGDYDLLVWIARAALKEGE